MTIARGSVHLAEIGNHDLAGSLEISPLSGIRKWRNSDRLAAIEAGEGGIDQFIHFHDARKLIHILTGVSYSTPCSLIGAPDATLASVSVPADRALAVKQNADIEQWAAIRGPG